ncbi:hypothetical protein D0869_04809 [Hortaea werneckii]|nr:hypothetical protein D0869_04809 [Hortaea werneckii]RMY19890.1 hypothetical protein D0867_04402 [Hortaea werneckii]RMY28864.1 hypothetical protein D0866_09108 [Hortaea werneckii]
MSVQIAQPVGVAQASQPKLEDRKSGPNGRLSPVASLMAGSIAGAVEASITYPFEFAKTRAQLRPNRIGGAPNNPLLALRTTVTQEGVRSVYTGCTTLIAGTALKAGVRFLTFDTTQALLADENGKLTATRRVLAGMAAGAVESILAVTPTERIKTALIDNAKGVRRFNSPIHATATILREQGIQGVYRGLLSTTIKQSATSAVRMGLYSTLREAYATRSGNAKPSSAVSFAIGAIAGTGTVYATQPFDTIKTRTQAAKGESFVRAIAGVVQTDGIRGFWRGSTMRLGRLVLSGGIVFSVYEKVADIFRTYR